MRILLVDDDAASRAAMRRVLESWDASLAVHEAAGVQGARTAVAAGDFDCILLDYVLPDGNGLELITQWRREGLRTPVLALTGQADDQLAADLLKAGADDYLSKARVTPEGIRRAIAGAIRVQHLEESARESNEVFSAIIRSSPLPIYAVNNQGIVTLWNPAAERVFGWKNDEVNGKFLPLTGQRERDEFGAICGRAMKGENVADIEVVRRRKDGSSVDLSMSVAPMRDRNGRIDGVLIIADDITMRKATEIERTHLLHSERKARAEADTARKRFEFLAEASRILSASLDYETTLTSLAKLAVPAIGDWCSVHLQMHDDSIRQIAVAHIDPEKLKIGQQVSERWPSNPSARMGVAEVIRSGQSQLLPVIDDELLRKYAADDEHYRTLCELQIHSAMIVPLTARGRTFGAMTFVASESKRTYSQDDLSLAEDIVRRAAIAVDNARLYREANRALAAKDQFIAVLSHELRTPLTPVLITVDSLASDPAIPAKLRDSVEMIRRNVELEARLIDDLLDLTRIAKGKLELSFQPLDALQCLRHTIEICRPDIDGKRIELSVSESAERTWVWGDPARLQQVFWNLIKNAVKFTASGGRVAVSCFNRDHQLVIQVHDDGIGIEPSILPRVFDAFEQGERAVTRTFGGLGLGLAITKALIDRHGGMIRAESPGRNRGATFTMELSTINAAASDQAPCAPPVATTPIPDLRILMVDDHEDTSRAMKVLLERHGYKVRLANSMSGALDEAAKEKFDLLISDIGLPDGTGIELMTHLRSRLGNVKGIALSGFGMEADIQRSKEAGFAEHLTKPIDVHRLQSVIKQLTSAS